MSKKDDLRAGMMPPLLKRTQVASDAEVTKAMNQVGDDLDAKRDSVAEKRLGSKRTTTSKKPATTRAKKAHGTKPETKVPPSKGKQNEAVAGAKSTQKSDLSKEAVKRMTIDLPKSLHTKLKLESTRRGIYMKDHIIELIEKSLR